MSEEARKVPSQIFRWFERMKESYDQSIQNTLTKFESYSSQQQDRIDTSHKAEIEHLKNMNEKQSAQHNKHIEQLHNDVNYYRQQIDKQQQTIDHLNTRYDAVIRCMLPNKQSNNIKDIFSEHDFLDPVDETFENNIDHANSNTSDLKDENTKTEFEATTHESNTEDITTESNPNELFDQAILKRTAGESDQAFILFEQAAKLGHVKSMGAMGRSFFLGEGTIEDPCTGLAWLINAANLELPQAIDRVQHFAKTAPDLYQEAKLKSVQLL